MIEWFKRIFGRSAPTLPTGWEWRALPPKDSLNAGAVLIDTIGEKHRATIRRYPGRTNLWCTSRGWVTGDLADAMRHVERELALLGWRDENGD